VKLPDPNPRLSVEEVRALYAHQYPDIATAAITGPEASGDKLVYRFTRAIGTKGYPAGQRTGRLGKPGLRIRESHLARGPH
jgi:PRTRC genetic system protein C